MTDLVPTARVDKNGRVVVRHMKPEGTGTSELKIPIPPIQQKPVSSPQLMRRAMENVFEAAGMSEYDWGQAVAMMLEQIESLMPSTLERMASLKNGEDGGVAHSIYNEFYAPKVDETFINDLAQIGPHIGERDIDPNWLNSCVRGFQNYDGLCPMGADGSYPEERYSQCTTLFDVTHAIRGLILGKILDKSEIDYGDQSGDERMIASKSLVDYIMSAKDTERERIAELISSRKIIDVEVLKGLIATGGTAALSSGAL